MHTKIAQIAADAFGIPMSRGCKAPFVQVDCLVVSVEITSTSTVANATCTAASVSSDLNGMAVLDACNQVKNTIQE